MVASTDAAVEADRQATVASSGLSSPEDADSPSALFGDAAPKDASADLSASETDSFASEPTFMEEDDFSSGGMSAQDEASFGDTASNEFSEGSFQEGELYDDTSSGGSEVGGTEEEASGLWSTLWDLFTGGSDE
jgi:hypothetical protein